MLFSEPKILNIDRVVISSYVPDVSVLFSEPKILNTVEKPYMSVAQHVSVLFSEPKILNSTRGVRTRFPASQFQCSSASRKFLNFRRDGVDYAVYRVSVLFSEPKIPQLTILFRIVRTLAVSVLFSEPKIPQPRD